MVDKQVEKIDVRYLNGPLKSAVDEILDDMRGSSPPDCLPGGYRLKSEPHRVRLFDASLTIWDAEYEGSAPS
ncbi:MAG: hypothetical protein ACUVSM_05880 [Armatimonadota bacterium]